MQDPLELVVACLKCGQRVKHSRIDNKLTCGCIPHAPHIPPRDRAYVDTVVAERLRCTIVRDSAET